MKTNFKKSNQSGFSLIETVIYLALFGIVIGGVVVSVYAMFESSSRNQTKAMVQEEGTFLLGKLDWALTGASAVSAPTSVQLSINRNGIPSTDNPLTFDASGGRITLARGTSAAQVLNNTNITIASSGINPIFTHTLASGDGIVPESIKILFTLTALTPNGQQYSQDFSTVKYLRK